MRQLIGFVPKQSTTALHERTKNLTGDVIAIENEIVTVNFTIIENKKEALVTLKYPLNECKKYFVNIEPIRKNGLTFYKFCMELHGLTIFHKGSEVPKWMLFWNGFKIDDILKQKKGITYDFKLASNPIY